MRVGIYPGTFNPVHSGHSLLLQAVANNYCLQRIIVIPSGCTPNKGKIQSILPFERWYNLRHSLSDISAVECSSFEINTRTCSYTANTLHYLLKKYPQDEFYLILGEDLLLSFPDWYRYEYILSNVKIITVKRYGYDQWDRSRICSNILFEEPVSDFSSSNLREAIATGSVISSAVNAIAENAIYAWGLYLPDSFKKIVGFVRSHQKPSRFKHTIGVVQTAIKLAFIFNINSFTVMEAAYLHDVAKELPAEMMKSFAAAADSDLGSSEIFDVLHAPAGAEMALKLFDISPEIYNAILFHCTLDEQMSLLDKIIFISDMVEPSRHYPAVERLRKAFNAVTDEQSLDSLLILAIELNICYISSIGGVVHPASLRALTSLKSKKEKENLWNQKN